MRIAVVIATYHRQDGKTLFYLKRALESIKSQTHKDYRTYVIGDDYSDLQEFRNINLMFPWAMFTNLSYSVERNKYQFGDMRLYCAGGLTAALTGVNQAMADGFQYVCHLDHDDWWEPNHLANINRVIELKNPIFVCTQSTYLNGHLPNMPISHDIIEYYPEPGAMVGSSACIKYSATKIRARDVFAETGEHCPGDADLWIRLSAEMKERNEKGYCFTSITCHHDEEGYSLRAKPVPKRRPHRKPTPESRARYKAKYR